MRHYTRIAVIIGVTMVLALSLIGPGAALPDHYTQTSDNTHDVSVQEVSVTVDQWTAESNDRRSSTGDERTPSSISDILSGIFDGNDLFAPDGPSNWSDDTEERDDEADSEDDGDESDDGTEIDDSDGEDDTDGDDADEDDGSVDADDGDDEFDERSPDSNESDDEDEADDGENDDDDGEDVSDAADPDDADESDEIDDTDDESDESGDSNDETDGSDDESDETSESDDETDESDDETDESLDRAAVEQYVHEAVNEERAAHGVDALEFDTELRDIARAHSEDMAERGYFSHTDPEGNDFADRYEDAGYHCNVNGYTGGENLAQTWYDRPVSTDSGTVHYDTERDLADGIVDQWMNSPGHEENLLASQWENQGIGIYVTDDGQVFATQNFC